MPKEKQRLGTGKRGPRKKDDSFLPTPVESTRDLEIDILNKPETLGLEALYEGILVCGSTMKHLGSVPADKRDCSNIYKISNSLTGLIRSLVELKKFYQDYAKLREGAKQEICFEIQRAWHSNPELAEKVNDFIEEVTGD
ncbi:MAG: hypothetical protein ACLPVO_09430 [Desulfomonilaceae bacterium]